MSNVARITYLPVELLNLLHQAESESKYTQFVTNKLLENTSLRESEQEKLIRYRRVLSHKEASRRFQVLTVSLRRIILVAEAKAKDEAKLAIALNEFLDPQPGRDPLYRTSLGEGDYVTLALVKSAFQRASLNQLVERFDKKSESKLKVLEELTLAWIGKIRETVSQLQNFVVTYEQNQTQTQPSTSIVDPTLSIPSPEESPEPHSFHKLLNPSSSPSKIERSRLLQPKTSRILAPNSSDEVNNDEIDVAMGDSTQERSTQDEIQSSGSNGARLVQSQLLAPLQSTHPGNALRSNSVPHPDSSPRVRLNPYTRSISPSATTLRNKPNGSNRIGSLPIFPYETKEQKDISASMMKDMEEVAHLDAAAYSKLRAASQITKNKLAGERRKDAVERISGNVEESFSDIRVLDFPPSQFEGVVVNVEITSRKSTTTLKSKELPANVSLPQTSSGSNGDNSKSSDSITLPPAAQPRITASPAFELTTSSGHNTTHSSYDLQIDTSTIFEPFTQAASQLQPSHILSSSESQSQSQSQSQSFKDRSESLENKVGSLDSNFSTISQDRAAEMHLAVQERKALEKKALEGNTEVLAGGNSMEVDEEEETTGQSFQDIDKLSEVVLSDEEEVSGFAELARAE